MAIRFLVIWLFLVILKESPRISELWLCRSIGQGAFGKVCEGRLHQLDVEDTGYTPVAVKVWRSQATAAVLWCVMDILSGGFLCYYQQVAKWHFDSSSSCVSCFAVNLDFDFHRWFFWPGKYVTSFVGHKNMQEKVTTRRMFVSGLPHL